MAFCAVEGKISSEGIAGISDPFGSEMEPEVKCVLVIRTGEIWM